MAGEGPSGSFTRAVVGQRPPLALARQGIVRARALPRETGCQKRSCWQAPAHGGPRPSLARFRGARAQAGASAPATARVKDSEVWSHFPPREEGLSKRAGWQGQGLSKRAGRQRTARTTARTSGHHHGTTHATRNKGTKREVCVINVVIKGLRPSVGGVWCARWCSLRLRARPKMWSVRKMTETSQRPERNSGLP